MGVTKKFPRWRGHNFQPQTPLFPSSFEKEKTRFANFWLETKIGAFNASPERKIALISFSKGILQWKTSAGISFNLQFGVLGKCLTLPPPTPPHMLTPMGLTEVVYVNINVLACSNAKKKLLICVIVRCALFSTFHPARAVSLWASSHVSRAAGDRRRELTSSSRWWQRRHRLKTNNYCHGPIVKFGFDWK